MDLIGTDLASLNGDLQTSVQGDLSTISGTDNLTLALQRRFETPIGALFYDQTYGNPVLDRLSQPMGQDFERLAISDVTACILADSRVTSTVVTLSVNREQRTVLFQVSYVAIDGTTGSFEQGVAIRV